VVLPAPGMPTNSTTIVLGVFMRRIRGRRFASRLLSLCQV
jgi:hypothetical protein